MRPFRLKNRRLVGNRATGAHKAKKIRMLFPRLLWDLMTSKMAAVAALALWFNSFLYWTRQLHLGQIRSVFACDFWWQRAFAKVFACVANIFLFKVFPFRSLQTARPVAAILIWLVTSLGEIRSNSSLLFDQRYDWLLKQTIKVFLWTISLKTPKSEWWKLNPS